MRIIIIIIKQDSIDNIPFFVPKAKAIYPHTYIHFIISFYNAKINLLYLNYILKIKSLNNSDRDLFINNIIHVKGKVFRIAKECFVFILNKLYAFYIRCFELTFRLHIKSLLVLPIIEVYYSQRFIMTQKQQIMFIIE